jgi:hypothetical protein
LKFGGSIDFGNIHKTVATSLGINEGPIRLEEGYPGPKGYGNLHVEGYEDRMKAIRGISYKSFAEFAFGICQNYTKIGKGDDGRLLLIWPRLVPAGVFDLRVIIQHTNDATDAYWTIVTGIFSRVARCEILYEKTREDESVPTSGVAERPRCETLSLPKSVKTGGKGS